jgi:hypothetical protein
MATNGVVQGAGLLTPRAGPAGGLGPNTSGMKSVTSSTLSRRGRLASMVEFAPTSHEYGHPGRSIHGSSLPALMALRVPHASPSHSATMAMRGCEGESRAISRLELGQSPSARMHAGRLWDPAARLCDARFIRLRQMPSPSPHRRTFEPTFSLIQPRPARPLKRPCTMLPHGHLHPRERANPRLVSISHIA